MNAPDLPVLLDRASTRPLAAQLATALRRAILDGTLRQDEPLPSTRALSATLRVSRGTVIAAYDQLAGEGYLRSQPGAAARVTVAPHGLPAAGRLRSGPPTAASEPARPAAAPAAPAPAATPAPTPTPTPTPTPAPTSSSTAAPPPTIDLAPGHPSTRTLVDPAWTAAWRSAVARSGRSDSPPPAGTLELRTAIAEHVRRARGLACRPDDVIVTAGTSDALAGIGMGLTARADGGSGLRIAVEDPGYPTARRVLHRVGASLVPVPTGVRGIDLAALAALEPAPHAVLVTPSHQYPLGSSLPVQNRLDLLDWARAAGTVIIEDDYDSEFRFGTAPLPALATLADSDTVVLVGSFSKTITPWIRAGYLVATGDLGALLRDVRQDLGPSVSGVQQIALAHYLDSGGLARNITRVRREYAHRRELVIAKLGALPGVRLSGLDGGLHVVVHTGPQTEAPTGAATGAATPTGAATGATTAAPTGADASALVRAAAARGVRVASLADYAVRDRGQRGLVLGYGAPTDLELARALDVLADLLTAN